MEDDDAWRLLEELNIVQAALLIIGISPTGIESEIEKKKSWKRPDGYDAAKTALLNAIHCVQIFAKIYICQDDDQNGPYTKRWELGLEIPEMGDISIYETLIGVDELKKWLTGRGEHPPFFFTNEIDSPSCLDKRNPRHSPKLTAAIKAWEAIQSKPALLNGKSAKQALAGWLSENAEKLDLLLPDGKHNKTAISEIAKLANWETSGGAPTTPRQQTSKDMHTNDSKHQSSGTTLKKWTFPSN